MGGPGEVGFGGGRISDIMLTIFVQCYQGVSGEKLHKVYYVKLVVGRNSSMISKTYSQDRPS